MKNQLPSRYPVIALLALFFSAPAFSAPALAQETDAKKSPLVGSWKWNRESLSGVVRCELHLQERDGEIVGTYQDGEEVKARVGEVSLDDRNVRITLVFDNDGSSSEVALTGKLNRNRITGKIVDGSDEQDWKARKFTSLKSAAGNWQMEFTTPDGTTRNPEFKLQEADGKPVVEFRSGEESEAGTPTLRKVKFRDGLLTFEVVLEFQGQDLKLEYELTIEGDELEGSMYYEFAQNSEMSGEVDVEGTRIR